MDKIKVFAPATLANFIVGFDSLGACLEAIDGELLGDIVSIEESETGKMTLSGPYADKLPKNSEDNIVTHCMKVFHHELKITGKSLKRVTIDLEKRLPIGSGLGSSASSIIATLVALNFFYDHPFTDDQILVIAGQMEAVVSGSIHYDNVAPCLRGGLQLMIPDKLSETLPWFDEWYYVLYHPGIVIPTKKAREILPKKIDLQQGIQFGQRLATFVHALYNGHRPLAIDCLRDPLIQPHRSKLIPHYQQGSAAAYDKGALAFGISGSGPTCFAIADSLVLAQNIELALKQAMQANQAAFSKIMKISPQGARLL